MFLFLAIHLVPHLRHVFDQNWNDNKHKVVIDENGDRWEWTTVDDGHGRDIRYPYRAGDFDICTMLPQASFFRSKMVYGD